MNPRNKESMVAFSRGSGDIHTFAAFENGNIGKVKPLTSKNLRGRSLEGAKRELKYWGEDNLLPQRRERVVMSNPITGALIQKIAAFIVGQGLIQFKNEYIDGVKSKIYQELSPDMQEWLETNDAYDKVLLPAAIDYVMHGGYFMEMIRSVEGEIKGDWGPIVSMQVKRAKYMRIMRKNSGVITHFAYCGDWKSQTNKSADTGEVEPVVIFDAFDKDRRHAKSIMYVGDSTFNDGYYCHPPYWGGEYWLEVGNNIPKYHHYGMNNAYKFEYKLTYPEGFFMDTNAYADAQQRKDDDDLNKCYNAEQEAKEEFLKQFENNMGGVIGTGKSIHCEKIWHEPSKSWVTIDIEVIKNDTKGLDLLALLEKVDAQAVSALGLPPILANIQMPGKTMASGSEAMNLYNIYINTSTPIPRMRILKPIMMMAKEQKFIEEGYKLTFEDAVLVTQDVDRSGVKSSTDAD